MNLGEAKEKFIQYWGSLGSQWGINRTMAQIHALLLVSPEPLTTEDVMEELQISRGNANMNLRELINWQLIKREVKSGERKEYFNAEKDMWKVFRLILKERKKREIEPMIQIIHELSALQGDKKNKEYKVFADMIDDLEDLTNKGDKIMELIIKSDENWFLNTFIKIVR